MCVKSRFAVLRGFALSFCAKDDMGHIYTTVVFDKGVYRLHAVAQSDTLRGYVCVADNRVQSVDMQRIKSIFTTGYGGFGSVTVVPMTVCKQVTDFRNLRILVVLHSDAALTYHFVGVFEKHTP